MTFQWRTGKGEFWEIAIVSTVLLSALVHRLGAWTLFGLLPIALLLRHTYCLSGRHNRIVFAEVTGWWWLPTHVMVCMGVRRLVVRRSEVSAVEYARLRRSLLNQATKLSGHNRL